MAFEDSIFFLGEPVGCPFSLWCPGALSGSFVVKGPALSRWPLLGLLQLIGMVLGQGRIPGGFYTVF